jgi:hypothetical protein
MIGMLVCDEYAVEAFRLGTSQSFETPNDFFAAKTGVYEESGVLSFEQRGVARAAGGQNGNSKGDAMCLRETSKILARSKAGVKGNVTKKRRREGAERKNLRFALAARQITNSSRLSEKPSSEPTTLAARRSDWKNSCAMAWISSAVTASSISISSCGVKWRSK